MKMKIKMIGRCGGGLGIIGVSYVGIDYLRHVSPPLHSTVQPLLWSALVVSALYRVPSYKHWPSEIRSVKPFILSIIFMLSTLLLEALSVRFVTAVLGLNWHSTTDPLPDPGQWILLALNRNLPQPLLSILRARIIGLHHFLMLFMMLSFSVLFGSVNSPGLGLGARYMFTMAIGRILRTLSFLFTIIPSPRPWCAAVRYHIPEHPHTWAQKYYSPYASDVNAVSQLLRQDFAYANVEKYIGDYHPDWGSMSFLIDFLRPSEHEGSSWYSVLKKAEGGCNDLVYSGHVLVAVLTAMAWTEAYGGFSSAIIWVFVIHSAQREVRERHHYTVDCIVAIYVGILIWKITGFMWTSKDLSNSRRLDKLEKVQGLLIQAAKDADMDGVRDILKEVESAGLLNSDFTKWTTGMWAFASLTIFSTLTIVVLALTLTSAG